MELSVYHYFDYRIFLRDTLRARSLSLAMVCRRVPGFSKAHLSLVLSGRRNLGPEKIETLGKAIQLKAEALRYFHFLVRFNQARSTSEQEIYLRELIPTRPKTNDKNLVWDQYLALRSWRCLAVRELMRLPNFDPNPLAVSKRFRGYLKPDEVKESIELLLRTGLASQNAEGKFEIGEETLRTTDEVSSAIIRSYHSSCLELATQALEKESVDQREFSSVMLALSEDEFRWLKAQIKIFREQAVSAEGKHPGNKRLYQVNVQLFPIAD